MKDDESSKMICFELQEKFINDMFSDISISKLNCIKTLNMVKPTEGSKLFVCYTIAGGGGSRIPSLARLHVLLSPHFSLCRTRK